MNIKFLIATALYCSDYHDGQWSKLYRIGCIARGYLLEWYQIRSPYDWSISLYIKDEYKADMMKMYRHLQFTKQGQ